MHMRENKAGHAKETKLVIIEHGSWKMNRVLKVCRECLEV